MERELQGRDRDSPRTGEGLAPDFVVLVAPDHYNGFFNELMPPFCIGTQAHSVGDYLSPAGKINVDTDAALRLATRLMDEDFDLAVSRRMKVDHGFAQPLQLLCGGLDTPPVVPIFVNAVAQPGIPRLRRCRALGQAIGRFLDGDAATHAADRLGRAVARATGAHAVAPRCGRARTHHRAERSRRRPSAKPRRSA